MEQGSNIVMTKGARHVAEINGMGGAHCATMDRWVSVDRTHRISVLDTR